jgi:hypothetical protein
MQVCAHMLARTGLRSQQDSASGPAPLRELLLCFWGAKSWAGLGDAVAKDPGGSAGPRSCSRVSPVSVISSST